MNLNKKDAFKLMEKWINWHYKNGFGSKEWKKEFGGRSLKGLDFVKSFLIYIYHKARSFEIADKGFLDLRCYICKKKIKDVDKELEEIYFTYQYSRLNFICSEKCDKRFRIKCTEPLKGFVMLPHAFEYPVRIKSFEIMKPLLSRKKHENVLKERNERFKDLGYDIPKDDTFENLKEDEITD